MINWRTIKFESESGKVLFTYTDIEKLPEWPEGPLLEILDGELYLVPSPTLLHQGISLNLASILKDFVQKHQLGRVFTAPIDVVFTDKDVAIPDIVFISKSRESILNPKFIGGAPDLIVEILSANKNRDLVKKKKMYEKYGVLEYWIIDPATQVVLIYILDPKTKLYREEIKCTKSEILKATTILHFEVPITTLFKGLT